MQTANLGGLAYCNYSSMYSHPSLNPHQFLFLALNPSFSIVLILGQIHCSVKMPHPILSPIHCMTRIWVKSLILGQVIQSAIKYNTLVYAKSINNVFKK
jgi:hypothetical protein